eukprot:1354_1
MINTAVINISILLVLLLNTVSGHMQYDLIGNSTTVNVTTSALKLDRNGKKVYQYAQHLHGLLIVPTSKYILEHIIKNQILTTHQIETLNNRTDIIFTIFDDPLTQLYTEYLLTIQRPTQNFGVISQHELTDQQYRDANTFEPIFGGTKTGIKKITIWLNSHNASFNTNNIDKSVAYDLFKQMVQECKLSNNLIKNKWLKKGTVFFGGHSLHNLIDTEFRKWIKTIRKRKKRNKTRSIAQRDAEEQETVSVAIIQQLTGVQDIDQQEPIIPAVQPQLRADDKAQYLENFDAAKYGDIMEQGFVQDNLIKFFKAEDKLQWKVCQVCESRRFTAKRVDDDPYLCDYSCHTERRKVFKEGKIDIEDYVFKYSPANDMNPGQQPWWARGVRPLEEAMVAAIVPVMSVVTLRSGHRKLKGSQINIRQDNISFAESLPRHVQDVPMIWVNKDDNNGHANQLFSIRKNVIRNLLKGLAENDVPYYKDIPIDYEYINALPDDGIPQNINHIVVVELEEKEESKEMDQKEEEKQEIDYEQTDTGCSNEQPQINIVQQDDDESEKWKDSIIYVEESNVRRIFIGTYKQKEEHKNLENQDEDLNDEKEEHKNLDRDDNKQKQKHKNLEIQDEDLNDANIVEYVSRGRSHIHISGRFSKHKLQGLTLKPT